MDTERGSTHRDAHTNCDANEHGDLYTNADLHAELYTDALRDSANGNTAASGGIHRGS
jgi:hypothetical protein